jgi:hypothetical protein
MNRPVTAAFLLLFSALAWADEESSVSVVQSEGSVEIVKSGSAAGKPAGKGDKGKK